MNDMTKSNLDELLKRYESVRFDKPEKEFDNIIPNSQFLIDTAQTWTQKLDALISQIESLDQHTLERRTITSVVSNIMKDFSILVDELERVRKSVVPPRLESLRLDLEKNMAKTLGHLELLLQLFVSDSQPKDLKRLQESIQGSLKLDRSSANIMKRKLKSTSSISHYKEQSGLVSLIDRRLLNDKTQSRLWLVAILALIAMWISDTPIESQLDVYRDWGKGFTLAVSVLWYPSTYTMSRIKKMQSYVIYAIIWASFAGVWSYGLITGLLIAVLLFAFPLSRLFRINEEKASDSELPVRLRKGLLRPYIIAWLFVALFLTHEPVWMIGLTIWLTYIVLIQESSYRFFRQTYDMIEDLYPNTTGREQRHQLFVIAIFATIFGLITGILGTLSPEMTLSTYSSIGNFALVLVTILLAVQAIIPGITTWSRESDTSKRIREMRFMIRSNKGLGGFMSIFFFLFIISNLSWIITERVLQNLPNAVDLRPEYLFRPIGNFTDIVNPFTGEFVYSAEATSIALSTLLFVACVGLTIYAVTQLYYLFTTANVFLLPIQDTLLSTSAHIEKITISSLKSVEKEQIPDSIKKLLRSNRKFNGYVISNIYVIDSPENADQINILVEFELDFPDKNEYYRLAEETYRIFFDRRSSGKNLPIIDKVQVSIFRDTHSRGRYNVFALQINRKKWEFLKKDVPEFSKKYKIESVLGAKIIEYDLPESQIL